MRLTAVQAATIRRIVREEAGDDARGGDVDLLLRTTMTPRLIVSSQP